MLHFASGIFGSCLIKAKMKHKREISVTTLTLFNYCSFILMHLLYLDLSVVDNCLFCNAELEHYI